MRFHIFDFDLDLMDLGTKSLPRYCKDIQAYLNDVQPSKNYNSQTVKNPHMTKITAYCRRAW